MCIGYMKVLYHFIYGTWDFCGGGVGALEPVTVGIEGWLYRQQSRADFQPLFTGSWGEVMPKSLLLAWEST